MEGASGSSIQKMDPSPTTPDAPSVRFAQARDRRETRTDAVLTVRRAAHVRTKDVVQGVSRDAWSGVLDLDVDVARGSRRLLAPLVATGKAGASPACTSRVRAPRLPWCVAKARPWVRRGNRAQGVEREGRATRDREQ